ncbi:MAG: hypothetical protein R2795_16145 [Saprospiraceae bacterium]
MGFLYKRRSLQLWIQCYEGDQWRVRFARGVFDSRVSYALVDGFIAQVIHPRETTDALVLETNQTVCTIDKTDCRIAFPTRQRVTCY